VTEQAGFGRAPMTVYDNVIPVTGTKRADGVPPARGRRGRKVLASIVVIAGLAGLGGIGYALLHRAQPTASTPMVGNTSRLHGPGPAATVRAYFRAINQHRYQDAWMLTPHKGSFPAFSKGYAGTADDKLTNFSVTGNVVSLTLQAFQTDGSVKLYKGSYTVVNGVITAAKVVGPLRATP
jgi:hypothetical protein